MQRPIADRPMPGWLNALITAPIVLGVLTIAGLGFYGSFQGMSDAARPYLHDDAWLAPAVIDAAIIVFTAYDLRAIRARVPVPWLRYAIVFLNFVTIVLNSAASASPLGKAFHAMFPVVYIFVVEMIRSSLTKWVDKADDRHMEPIPWNMWLTPVSTAAMWYRRNRWRIKTLDELVAREQARELAVLRLKEKAGRLSRWWWPRWKKRATADELWAIRTYALSPDGAMRKTAAAVTKVALSASPADGAHAGRASAPERAQAAPSAPERAPERERARTPGPAAAARQGAPQPRSDADARWERLMSDPESRAAWEVYRRLRAETGERPAVKDVHEQSGVRRDRSSVSRWCKQFDARWAEGAHEAAPEDVHSGGVHAQPQRAQDERAQPGVHAQARESVHAGAHEPPGVHAQPGVHTAHETTHGTTPEGVHAGAEPAAHTDNGKVPAG